MCYIEDHTKWIRKLSATLVRQEMCLEAHYETYKTSTTAIFISYLEVKAEIGVTICK